MASPAEPTQQAHPLTPPAETQSNTQSQQSQNAQPSRPDSNPHAKIEALLSQPLTSLDDNGTSKRPRDHRLIHLLLASHGVTAYQERVPLQLMDFAYRYTSSVLSDAIHIQNEGYDHSETAAGGGGAGAGASGTGTTSKGTGRGGGKNQNKGNEEGDISLNALRFAIGSKMGYQFSGTLPKEFLKQLADERNRVSLAAHARDDNVKGNGSVVIGGVKLPHEKYCLTGVSWGLKDEWESEGEESVEDDEHNGENGTEAKHIQNSDSMQLDGAADGAGDDVDEDEDDEGAGTMEDVFGPDGGGNEGDDDAEMQDI